MNKITNVNSVTFYLSPQTRRTIWLALIGSIIRHGIAAYGPLLAASGAKQTMANLKNLITSAACMITGLPNNTEHGILHHSAALQDLDAVMREECVRSYARALQMPEDNPLHI